MDETDVKNGNILDGMWKSSIYPTHLTYCT